MNKFKYSIPNTLKIEIQGFNALKSILEGLKSSLSNDDFKEINSVSQFGSTKLWLVNFKTNAAYNNCLNKDISVNNTKVTLQDMNKKNEKVFTIKAVLRIHWLPPNYGTHKVIDAIYNCFRCMKEFKILEVCEETVKIPGMEHIKNGVYKVKVEYLVDEHHILLSSLGVDKKIFGHRILLQLSGHPPKCLRCQKFGHIANNCPDRQLQCENCNQFGHLKEKCSIAFRLKDKTDILDEQDEVIDDEENANNGQNENTQEKIERRNSENNSEPKKKSYLKPTASSTLKSTGAKTHSSLSKSVSNNSINLILDSTNKKRSQIEISETSETKHSYEKKEAKLKKNDFEDEDTENDTEEVFVPPTPIYQAGDGDPSMNSSF
jgi:hypothetical protein